jgi:hypothetical protein
MAHRKLTLLVTISILAGCAALGSIEYDRLYGEAQPRERVVASLPSGEVDYWTEVKPILEQRCVVCHGCYDAQCQLKLSSIEGLERGASKAKVYDATRLVSAPTSRLFEDAFSVAEWRERGFFPVLNERAETPEANRAMGVMHRLLTLKQENPLPGGRRLPDNFDLSLDRAQFCPTAETLDQYAKRHPLWGMPYALPGLPAHEQQTLLAWLEQGAAYTAREPVAAGFQAQVDKWEAFFNGDSFKEQLVSRYLYEHLYIADLYFPETGQARFFRLVRSATPPGQPVRLIATRRPYNDPGVERVFYRIQPVLDSITAKSHLSYALDDSRMQRWQEIFLAPDYEVTALPSYADHHASNPFRTFRELPVRGRYRFLLDEARYTIATYIKGPVCRGSVALNVINDNFWVVFVDPNHPLISAVDDFYANQAAELDLPAGSKDIFTPLTHWRRYAKQERRLLAEKDQWLSELAIQLETSGLDLVWDGDGTNDNASLTIFRHEDSASVEQGLLGAPPKTAWLIGYGLLERIYYLLVAGYDPYGNVGHQLLTRLYMDFLRMEGESNFLRMLPAETRDREREYWYRGASSEVMEYMTLPGFESKLDLSSYYQTDDPKQELFDKLAKRLASVTPLQHKMESIRNQALRAELDRLNRVTGTAAALMPQVTFVRIRDLEGGQFFTLIHNNAHLNQTSLFKEQANRIPEEDTLTLVPGFIGAYPNAFLEVDFADLAAMVTAIEGLRSEEDYAVLRDNWGIRRTDRQFWKRSDEFQAAYRQSSRYDSGILDFNRLENR